MDCAIDNIIVDARVGVGVTVFGVDAFLGYLLGKEDDLLNLGCHGCSMKDGVSERLVGEHQEACLT